MIINPDDKENTFLIKKSIWEWGAAHNHQSCFRQLMYYQSTYQYKWISGKLYHPLPNEESKKRIQIVNAGFAWLSRVRTIMAKRYY